MEKPEAHLFLPAIDRNAEGANFALPDTFGYWQSFDRGVMQKIAAGISITKSASATDVASVPDVWARALQFQSALRKDSRHPKRDSLLREWRGLMSLLALQRIHRSNLQIAPINAIDTPFWGALEKLCPKPIRLQNNDTEYHWTHFLLIRYEDIPLGAFSPATLVFTASDYHRHPDWKSKRPNLTDEDGDHRLCPPQLKSEILYVGEWLCHLMTKLNEQLYSGKEELLLKAADTIKSLIEDWLGDIRKTLGYTNQQPIECTGYEIDSEPIALSSQPPWLKDYNVYQLLLHPLTKTKDADTAQHTDFSLRWNNDHPRSKYKEVVVITRNLLETRGAIWTDQTIDHVGKTADLALSTVFKDASGRMINGVKLDESNALWIRPEAYFLTDTLLRGAGGAFLNIAEVSTKEDATYILPFKQEILDFFPPDKIVEELKPAWKQREDGVEFSFSLPIQGRDPKHVISSERVVKKYKYHTPGPEEGVILEIPVPYIAVFPNYLGKNWRRYYVYQSDAQQMLIKPYAAGYSQRSVKPEERDLSDAGNRSGSRIIEIAGDDPFPEGIGISLTKDRERTECGMILLQRPELRGRPEDVKWTIGIDFGTCNTNAWKKIHDGEADKLSLRFQHHLRLLTSCDDQEQKDAVSRVFVPVTDVELPIPTHLWIPERGQMKRLYLDYSIFFPDMYLLPIEVRTEIKWDAANNQRIKFFLEHLLTLLFIELVSNRVANVQFVFSYPKAFSTAQYQLFRITCQDVLKSLTSDAKWKLLAELGTPGTLAIEGSPRFVEEGKAAGNFFGSDDISKAIRRRGAPLDSDWGDIWNKAVCIDVGGATTDISIWHKQIVLDASILLAGNRIADLLAQNPAIWRLLFSDDACRAMKDKSGKAFAACFNMVLRKEESDILKRLSENAQDKDIKWLRKMLFVEFGAIVYYCAALLGAAASLPGSKELASKIAKTGIRLHWGGNGAKLLRWMNHGKDFEPMDIASEILSSILWSGLDDCLRSILTSEEQIRLKKLGHQPSPWYKSEAAGGLVVMAHDSQKEGHASQRIEEQDEDEEKLKRIKAGASTSQDVKGIVSGEEFQLKNGTEVGFLDRITEDTLYEQTKPETQFKSTRLTRLAAFLKMLNGVAKVNGVFAGNEVITLNERDCDWIKDQLESWFERQATERSLGDRQIEPIFIIETRLLMERLARERVRS